MYTDQSNSNEASSRYNNQMREEPSKASAVKLSTVDKFAGTEILKGCCYQGCCAGGIPL